MGPPALFHKAHGPGAEAGGAQARPHQIGAKGCLFPDVNHKLGTTLGISMLSLTCASHLPDQEMEAQKRLRDCSAQTLETTPSHTLPQP